LILASSTLVFLLAMWAVPRIGLGQEDPGFTRELLRSAPFDRITLVDRAVIKVEPITPRPLPPYDPAKDKDTEKEADADKDKDKGGKSKRRAPREKESDSQPPAGGNIFLDGEKPKPPPKSKKQKDEEPQINEITIHLLEGDIRDFRLRRMHIQKIEYFEDMLLAESDRLIAAHDYARAFECCLRVKERQNGWKGLDDQVNKVLFAEGSEALINGDGEQGMRLLRELLARKPDYPGLTDKIAASYSDRVTSALRLGLFLKGRKTLHELEQLAPNHPVVRDLTARFIARANEYMARANKAKGVERQDALSEALRIWPKLQGGADQAYAEAFAEEPTLDVEVDDVSGMVGPWVRSPGDERIARLLFMPVLARDDDESVQGKARGQLAESLKTSDLGRRLIVNVRSNFRWSDGSRPTSAIDVARTLTDRTEPSSPLYNARWANLLDRVDAPEEFVVEIRLTRPFLKPASWLLCPIGPAHAGFDGRVATLDQGRLLVGNGPFRGTYTGKDRVELRAPDTGTESSGGKVRRIREARQLSANASIGALLRGEVTLVEHLPPDRVASLAENPDIKIGRYTQPSLHRIAIDGRTPALRKRELRRGLSYAINRSVLLEETILHRSPESREGASDGPFAKGTYADAPDVKPLGYDPLLAKMLVAGARKELGGQPIRLTFAYPAIPEAQAVVPKIIEAFQLVGVEIVPSEQPESVLEADLRAGKRFDLAYRAGRCDEPIIEAGPFLCPAYDAPASTDPLASVCSPAILRLLLELERAPEFPTAKGLIIQLDRESRDELPMIPLWQIETHYAWRTRLKGPAEVSDHLYQGIETWEIEPWFAKDPW
jgi:peptide/nickel transport system substrate-binding protein